MYEQLSKNIRTLSKFNNIKLGDLEKQMGVTPGYTSRIDGRRRLSMDKIAKAAEILNVSIDDIWKKDFELELRTPIVREELKNAYLKARKYMSKKEIKELLDCYD